MQGPNVTPGYWENPGATEDAFLEGSWIRTGDLARTDEDGFVYIVDRLKDMIISGGENIYPSEVEAVLGAHPSVQDVAVVGLPDEKWGERVHAVVILRDGALASDADLSAWCRDRVAGYKRPRSFSFLREDEVPRTATVVAQGHLETACRRISSST